MVSLVVIHSYWCLVLLLKLDSVAHSPMLDFVGPSNWNGLPLEIDSCLKLMKVRFAGCLRLICRLSPWLG